MDDLIREHYERLATSYDQFLYYSDRFIDALVGKMLEQLRLEPNDQLVDLGCGTGMYSLAIRRRVRLERPVLAVDPFHEMLAQIPEGAGLVPIQLDALAFSRAEHSYSKVLMKEAVHHVTEKVELFGNLYRRLPPGGTLLLVHVPPQLDYPLFRKALERSMRWHADPDELTILLKAAGFTVERDRLEYPHQLPRDHYFQMVRGRYMTLLSSFSDAELAEGLAEMEQRYHDQSVLKFLDRFDYLTARKPTTT